MDYRSLVIKLIQNQNEYIRHLEVYRIKDEAQELLIQEMNHSLDLLAREISRLKAENRSNSQEKQGQ